MRDCEAGYGPGERSITNTGFLYNQSFYSYLNSFLTFADQLDYNSADYSSESITKTPGDTLDFDTFNYEEFAKKAGFRLNESLVQCDWRGRKNSCSAKNFTQVNMFAIFVVVHSKLFAY